MAFSKDDIAHVIGECFVPASGPYDPRRSMQGWSRNQPPAGLPAPAAGTIGGGGKSNLTLRLLL